MYVCISVCMSACRCVFVYKCMHVCRGLYVCGSMEVGGCLSVCLCMYVCMCAWACVYAKLVDVYRSIRSARPMVGGSYSERSMGDGGRRVSCKKSELQFSGSRTNFDHFKGKFGVFVKKKYIIFFGAKKESRWPRFSKKDDIFSENLGPKKHFFNLFSKSTPLKGKIRTFGSN